jgi:hypothetical protein
MTRRRHRRSPVGEEDNPARSSTADFIFDAERTVYVCPNNKLLHTTAALASSATMSL